MGNSRSLGDSFYILRKNEVISEELMNSFHKMVGFRNIATHAYKEISYPIVKSIVEHHLSDSKEFYTKTLEYTQNGNQHEYS